MKKFKLIISTFMILLSFVTLFMPASASDDIIQDGDILPLPDKEEVQVYHPTSPSLKASVSYNYVGTKRYWGLVRYYDYLCYKNSSIWICFTGLNLTDDIYHTKNSGKKELYYTKSVTYSSQTASNFSVGAGAEARVGDMVKASSSLGVGITKTVSKKYTASSTIMAKIPKSAETGHYKMHVCYNFYRTRIVQQRVDGSHQIKREISMPFNESYSAILYSPTGAAGTWKIW